MSRLLTHTAVPALALALSGCDTGTSTDVSRYQQWAQTVSTIPLDPAKNQSNSNQSQIALEPSEDKPSDKSLRVELMTPHQLWDIRNGPLKVPSMEVLENISPTELVRTTSTPAASQPQAPQPNQRPAKTAPVPVSTPTKLIQLGAYSSEQAARQAWQRVESSVGASSATGLEPHFEQIDVAGRQLVRLRVATTDSQARILCEALASNDPWCKSPS